MNGLDKLIKRYESRLELVTELRDSSLKKVMEKVDALKRWVANAELFDIVYFMDSQLAEFEEVRKEYEKRCDDFYSLRKALKELKELAEKGEQK